MPPASVPGRASLSSYAPAPAARHAVGDVVEVRRLDPPGHCRTPFYVRGKTGTVERICGDFQNPEERAYRLDGGTPRTLYRVSFLQADIWPEYTGSPLDRLELEVYEHWLQARPTAGPRGGS